jgi:hypothetical protein
MARETIMAFSDTVKRVIELATAIREYWDAELPKRHPKYPLVQPGEDSGPPPPKERELQDLLRSLPAENISKLLTLMRLSRGGFPATEFHRRWQALAKTSPDPEWAVSYLSEYAPLAEELADGLQELAASGIDLDSAQPSPA